MRDHHITLNIENGQNHARCTCSWQSPVGDYSPELLHTAGDFHQRSEQLAQDARTFAGQMQRDLDTPQPDDRPFLSGGAL